MMPLSSCRKARFLAALAPDEVLSEFEQRLLDGHLQRCPTCAAFAAGIADSTETLRTQPLEQPLLAPIRAQYGRSTRRRLPRFSFVTAAASVAATFAAAGVAVVVGNTTGGHPAPTARPVIVIDATSVDSNVDQAQFLHELRDYRNAQHTTESNLVTDRRPGFNAG